MKRVTDFIPPMLAKETDKPFDDAQWIFEIKWDGYRAIAEKRGRELKLYSRNGNSFLERYDVVADALKKIPGSFVVDGEIVLLNEDGMPDFQALQHYEENRNLPLVFCVFDLLEWNKKPLYDMPLTERKALLQTLVGKNPVIRYSDHVTEEGDAFFAAAMERNLEGIMAKLADSTYVPGKRTSDWLKVKGKKTEDVAIAGFTDPSGSRKYFGALILATRKEGKWVYAGNVGTGFNQQTLKEIHALLKPLEQNKPAFETEIRIKGAHFTSLKYACEVEFTEWTKEGRIRHPVFKRLRTDKPLKDIHMPQTVKKKPVKKTARKVAAKKVSKKSTTIKAAKKTKKSDGEELKFGRLIVNVSNPDKLYFKKEGISKLDVLEYYQSVAEYILPFFKNRPQSLLRHPDGIDAKGFFQKDAGDYFPDWIPRFNQYSESSKREINYVMCNNKATLAYLNNLGCIEFNPWHSTARKPSHPGYVIIDLDPSPKNTFDEVIEVAQYVKEILDKAGADAYVKTSGGSGIHVYIPLKEKYDYETAKNFAHIVCMLTEEALPEITTLERSLKKRDKKKIYLDYLQNAEGQTIASVYSLRPKPGAPVSAPLEWRELKKGIRPTDFNIHNMLQRIKKKPDIFNGILGKGINLADCLRRLSKEA